MRGKADYQSQIYYAIDIESWIPEDHPLRAFFDRVVESAYGEEWASSDHFTVDGTLIESYASMKSLRPQGSEAARVSDGSDDDDQGNPTMNFRGEKRSNRTHRSLTGLGIETHVASDGPNGARRTP